MDENKRALLQKWISSKRINKLPDYITPDLLADKEFALAALRNGWDIFQHLPDELKLDKDVAVAKVTYCYSEHAIDRSLYKDKDVLLASVLKETFYLNYISDELRNDKEVFLAAICYDPYGVISYIPDELKKDKEFALVAVSQHLREPVFQGESPQRFFNTFDPSLRKDRDVVFAAVKANPAMYTCIDLEFRMDKQLAIYALAKPWKTYNFVPKELGRDKHFIMEAFDYACSHRECGIKGEPNYVLNVASKELLDDRELILKTIKSFPSSFSKASYRLRKDKELAMLALDDSLDDPARYSDLSFTLKKDPDIILYLAKKRFEDLYYCKIVKEDGDFFIRFHANAEKIESNMRIGAGIGLALGAFAKDGVDAKITQTADDIIDKEEIEDLTDADFDLKIDRQFLIDIMLNNHNLRSNKQLSIEVVEDDKDLKALYVLTQYDLKHNPDHRKMAIGQLKSPYFKNVYIDFSALSDRLKSDREVAFALITYRPDGIKYVSDDLKADKELIKQAYLAQPFVINYASKDLLCDDEFMKELIAIDGRALEKASDNLKSNKEIVMQALDTYPEAYCYVSSKLKADKEVAIKAVSKNGKLLESVDKNIRGDRDVVLAAVSNDGRALSFAPIDFRRDREIALAAIASSGEAYRYIDEDLKADKELLLKASSVYPKALIYAPNEYRKDKEIIRAAVANNPEAIKYALGGLQSDPDFLR